MEENIALIIPMDCPEFKTFNLPTIGSGTIFQRMQEIMDIKTPTLVPLTEREVDFLLENRGEFDVPMYMIEHLPDYDFSPKWITLLTQFETVSFDALSQLISAYQQEKAESEDSIRKAGDHIAPVVGGGITDEEDDDVQLIEPERL